MAHFAEIDSQGNVLRVIVVNNDVILTTAGNESERKGVLFCKGLFGGTWVQTSYNGSFRKNYAGIGYKYDRDRDAFIPPKPYESWILNEETCLWDPPVAYPRNNENYFWDEATKSWIK
jgi:hypothetical protein